MLSICLLVGDIDYGFPPRIDFEITMSSGIICINEISLVDDSIVEVDETFFLLLDTSSDLVMLNRTQAVFLIVDTDGMLDQLKSTHLIVPGKCHA